MAANPNAGTQMFYVRQSDGLAYCFSPVPFIQDSKQILLKIKDGVETRIGIIHTLSFNGTLLPNIPALSGIDPNSSCLEILDRKSDQLCSALDENRGNLLIVDSSGYPVLSVFPKVVSIDFPESQMVVKRDYSLVFEYEESFSDDCKVSEFDESWDFSAQEDDTISASHSVNAVGISNLDGTGALANAKIFVLDRADSLDRTQYSFLTAPFVPAVVDADNLAEYNHIRTENVNEVAGSYSISETWILSSGNFKDDRTIDRSFELNDLGVLFESLTINGTIQGYGDTTTERLNNARAAFNNIVSVEIGFYTALDITSKTTSENRFSGTVNYSVSFGNADVGDILEGRTISYSLQRNDDATVSQTVTTTATVRLASDSGIQSAINFCFANNFPINSTVEPYFTAALSGNIESVSYQRDELTKTFSLSRTYREQGTPLYREEYQVSREQNLENALTTITVNGTVQGMSSELSTSSNVRFIAASGAFFSIIEPLILDRALDIAPSNTCLTESATTTSLGYNKLNGTITYSYKFDNRFLTSNPNISDEKVDVSYNLPADTIAIIPIPKKSDGPILQDQETQTGPQKTLKITYTMTPSGVNCGAVNTVNQGLLESEALTESNILVNNTPLANTRGEKPVAAGVFKTADGYTFNRQSLVFTRNVTWQYTIT
jgi:hypothetical protein